MRSHIVDTAKRLSETKTPTKRQLSFGVNKNKKPAAIRTALNTITNTDRTLWQKTNKAMKFQTVRRNRIADQYKILLSDWLHFKRHSKPAVNGRQTISVIDRYEKPDIDRHWRRTWHRHVSWRTKNPVWLNNSMLLTTICNEIALTNKSTALFAS